MTDQRNYIHVCRRRGPGETLVFIHGLTDDSDSFARVASALGSYYDIVRYDLRGHGKSDTLDNKYELEDHASDLLRVLEREQVSDVTLIGHSLGAEIALHVARSHPELVRRLVAEDPPWHPDWIGAANKRRVLATTSWRKWVQHLQALSLDDVIKVGLDETPHWSLDDIRAWAAAKHVCRLESLDSVLAFRDPYPAIVSELQCPTLLILGDARRGALVTSEMALHACRLSSLIQVAAINGAGHGIHRDQFDAYVGVLKTFLRE